jgi:hypothetical protein
MKRLGLGDLGAGRRKVASQSRFPRIAGSGNEIGRKRKNRRPSGFPNNKAKTALKLPWLRNAQLLHSQTEFLQLNSEFKPIQVK